MRRLAILGIIIIVGIVSFMVWWHGQSTPVDRSNKDVQSFVIKPGEALSVIGEDLHEQGIIKSPLAFRFYVMKNGLGSKIQAGDFKLSPSMNLEQVLQQLTTGRADVWITIPEGLRSEEIAAILEEQVTTYDDSWVERLKEEEGFLFPDTYLIPMDTDIETVISILKGNFNKKVSEAGLNPNSNLNETLTLASLIEREAITDDEKPIIAGILTNRINEGMPLQVDATIQYVKGNSNKWWPGVAVSDYKNVKSPYNTYLVVGLPPGPIANPGIEAIKAAANPADTDYFYYIHAPNGQIYYAKTLEEHNRNVNRYLR